MSEISDQYIPVVVGDILCPALPVFSVSAFLDQSRDDQFWRDTEIIFDVLECPIFGLGGIEEDLAGGCSHTHQFDLVGERVVMGPECSENIPDWLPVLVPAQGVLD